MWRKEIRLAGSGGQGLGLAAMVLADAALRAGLHATIMQSYGPEARGGASRADVTLSDQPIANPWFPAPQILLALSQKAWDRFSPKLGADAVAVVDLDRVQGAQGANVWALPFERTARAELREKVAANMLALGALGVVLEHIPQEILAETAQSRAPKGFGQVNRTAVARGWRLMGEALGGIAHADSVGP